MPFDLSFPDVILHPHAQLGDQLEQRLIAIRNNMNGQWSSDLVIPLGRLQLLTKQVPNIPMPKSIKLANNTTRG
jgi:hypothetical protein